MKSQPIHCPKCKGKGSLYKQIGRCHDTVPFSKEHWNEARELLPNNKVIGLEEFGVIVECSLCQGSGTVFATPARITGRGLIKEGKE